MATYEEMQKQLERLERNLREQNPVALENLHPGLTLMEIEAKALSYGVEFEPELVALYSWRNGGDTWRNRRPKGRVFPFLPGYVFLDLDQALREGNNANPSPL